MLQDRLASPAFDLRHLPNRMGSLDASLKLPHHAIICPSNTWGNVAYEAECSKSDCEKSRAAVL